MGKFTIIDTPWDTSPYLEDLKNAGISTVIRYYDIHNSHKLPQKRLEKAEAEALSKHNMEIMVIFQALSNSPTAFSHALGMSHVDNAYRWAKEGIGQPEGSAIYFAVDFNASQEDLKEHVIPYFKGIQAFLQSKEAPYKVGVYGSGLVVNTLFQQNLVAYRWLSMSHGFEGTRTALQNGQYELHQIYPPDKLGELSVDFDEKKETQTDIGAFRLTRTS